MLCVERMIFLSVLIIFFTSAVSEEVHTETVLLGNNIHLMCEYNGKESINFYRWSNKISNSPFLVIQDSDCQEMYNENKLKYTGRCSDKTIILTISNITLQDHESTIICQTMLMDDSLHDVNKTQIYVSVPTQYVYLATQDGYIPENTSISMVCNTSYSRPTPNVRWFLDPGTESKGDDSEITFGVSNTTSENDKLYSIYSTLRTSFNRNVNGWQIYCSTSNVPRQSIDSEKFLLNITYPPDGPPEIGNCVNCKTYKIIENTQGSLTCTSTGGNPLPQLTWECFYAEEQTSVAEDTVTTSLLINASKQNYGVCSCFSKDVNNKRRNTSIIIDVLYPPDVPVITYYNGTINIVVDELKVIENRLFSLSCNSRGNPPPKYTWWNSVKHVSQNYSSRFDRHQHGNLTCAVSNVMRPDYQKELLGANSKTITVDILYPPEVMAMTEQNIVEHSDFNISCRYTRGNPSPTTVRWTRNKKKEQEWDSDWLSIKNVSKEDDDTYTCHASNKMNPTGGQNLIGPTSKQFHLNVLYKATVREFYIIENAIKIKNKAVVKSNSTVTFHCNVDANPLPTVEISFHGRVQSWNTTSAYVKYKKNVSCADAGLYVCSTRNYLNNEKTSEQSLIVIVLCSPRPSPIEAAKYNKVATPLHSSASFEFKAQEYLDINTPSFFWKKQQDSELIGLSGNAMLNISESEFQTNLTFSNVTLSDYGTYLLVVNNSIGVYKHHFNLIPDDIPEIPRNFEVVETHVTTSTALLRWLSGFHGGHPQTFVIKFKKRTEDNWTNVTVKDTGTSLENAITIKGLSSSTWYEIKMYAQNTLGRTNTTDLLQFQTKAAATGQTRTSFTGIMAGSISGILVVIAGFLFGLLIYRKRTGNGQNNDFYGNVRFTGNRDARSSGDQHLMSGEAMGQTSQDDLTAEYSNATCTIENLNEIEISELFVYVTDRNQKSFEHEFSKLPKGLQKPYTDATKRGVALNRYNRLFPSGERTNCRVLAGSLVARVHNTDDHSRVKILNDPNFYINACYIHGNTIENAYIASLGSLFETECQKYLSKIWYSDFEHCFFHSGCFMAENEKGPTVKVTDDFRTFWKMVWFENVDIIVMLTNLFELSGMKCEQYWPEIGREMLYGEIRVTFKKIDAFAEYTVRYFTIENASKKRGVTHLQYTAWPDKTVPENVYSLLDFRQTLRTTPSTKKGPVLVHCSNGTGRTGTFIALDRQIEQGQNKGSVNVFECVKSLREQRVNMVQTLEQYIYIHKALVYSLYFDCEMISVDKFQEYVNSTNNEVYTRQYNEISQTVEISDEEEKEACARNKKRVDNSCQGADIPESQHRVHLYMNRDKGVSDYIDAVYVNSLKKKNHFIVAESPMPETVSVFVCMIYQENCCCVVTMEDFNEQAMAIGQYLPTVGETLRFGDFQVTCTAMETKAQYSVREMTIRYSGQLQYAGEKVTYHFQYNRWVPESNVPSDPIEFVQFIKDVESYADQHSEKTFHVLVQCTKPNESSALYCIVSILMEKIRYERQVSVLNTVRHFWSRRRTAIASMKQLKFCYMATCACISMHESSQ